jgi:hypothetical protein
MGVPVSWAIKNGPAVGPFAVRRDYFPMVS